MTIRRHRVFLVVLTLLSPACSTSADPRAQYLAVISKSARSSPLHGITVPGGTKTLDMYSGGNTYRGERSADAMLILNWVVKHPTPDLVAAFLADAQNRGVTLEPLDCALRTGLIFGGEVPMGPTSGQVSIGFEREADHSVKVSLTATNVVPDSVGQSGDAGPYLPDAQPVANRHDWPQPLCTKIP